MRWAVVSLRLPLAALALCATSLARASPGDTEAPRKETPTRSAVAQFNLSPLVFVDYWRRGTAWHPGVGVGFRPELIFGRRSNQSWGAGGYLQVSRSSNANGVLLGAGTSLLIPLWRRDVGWKSVVLAPAVGGYVQHLDGFEPGMSGSVYFGYCTFNSLTSFDSTLGLFGGAHWGFGASHERSFMLGVRADLMLLVAAGAVGG